MDFFLSRLVHTVQKKSSNTRCIGKEKPFNGFFYFLTFLSRQTTRASKHMILK